MQAANRPLFEGNERWRKYDVERVGGNEKETREKKNGRGRLKRS